jgi:hypothetical protein
MARALVGTLAPTGVALRTFIRRLVGGLTMAGEVTYSKLLVIIKRTVELIGKWGR